MIDLRHSDSCPCQAIRQNKISYSRQSDSSPRKAKRQNIDLAQDMFTKHHNTKKTKKSRSNW